MASILTTDSTITCDFHGTATLASTAKLRVGGAPVLLASDVTTWTMTGCQQVTGNTKTPCVKLLAPSAGQAQKLTSDGSAVLLGTFSAMTASPPASHGATASGSNQKVTAS